MLRRARSARSALSAVSEAAVTNRQTARDEQQVGAQTRGRGGSVDVQHRTGGRAQRTDLESGEQDAVPRDGVAGLVGLVGQTARDVEDVDRPEHFESLDPLQNDDHGTLMHDTIVRCPEGGLKHADVTFRATCCTVPSTRWLRTNRQWTGLDARRTGPSAGDTKHAQTAAAFARTVRVR